MIYRRSRRRLVWIARSPDAVHCLELGVIDGIVLEPTGGAHTDVDGAARLLKETLADTLEELEGLPGDELKRARRAKFRRMGLFEHAPA